MAFALGLSGYRCVAAGTGVKSKTTVRERCDGVLSNLIPHTPSRWGIAGTAARSPAAAGLFTVASRCYWKHILSRILSGLRAVQVLAKEQLPEGLADGGGTGAFLRL